jgi:hypothetical protein
MQGASIEKKRIWSLEKESPAKLAPHMLQRDDKIYYRTKNFGVT